MSHTANVTTATNLIAATQDSEVREIVVSAPLRGLPTIALARGQALRGATRSTYLEFAQGIDGVMLSSDNRLSDLVLHVSPEKRAIFNNTSLPGLGVIELQEVATTGRVQILARDNIRAGHIEVNGLDIIAADARSEIERPHEYGVHVLQGALTVWNMQPDEAVELTANLVGLSAGRAGRPVLGSGIFVSGAGDSGGRLRIQHLDTNAVYSDGMIPPGTSDQISGGVFTVFGVHVDVVHNYGPVTTYGANDMALDNWGTVERWTADEPISTRGVSGIGFVDFGKLGHLRLKAPIETFGQGARGFNVYAGTVDIADFDRIITHGNGAVGIQIAQPIGRLIVRRGIETYGGAGASLVKGVLQTLSAIALSVKPGGSVCSIDIQGGIKTHSEGISPIEQHGSVGNLVIRGGCEALGGGF